MTELLESAADTSKQQPAPLPLTSRMVIWSVHLPNSTVWTPRFVRSFAQRPMQFYRLLRNRLAHEQQAQRFPDALLVAFHQNEGFLGAIDASTEPSPRPTDLDTTMQAVFEQAREQDFEDGMESEFSQRLEELVLAYGNEAVEVIDYFVRCGQANPEVLSEALRWLGNMKDEPTRPYRRWVLVKALGSASMSVRCGAVMGLAVIDDPAVLSDVRAAADREPTTFLQQVMEALIGQLEDTARCQGCSD